MSEQTMHAGLKKTYYRCFPQSESAVSIAAYVEELSDPDELPKVANLLSLEIGEGWTSSWIDGDHICDFFRVPGEGRSVVALSETGRLYRPLDGELIGKIAKSKLTGMHGAANTEETVFVCGFNGRFFVSETGFDFKEMSKEFQRQVPNPETTPMEELIKWAQSVTHYYAAAALSDTNCIITGSDGAIVYFDGKFKDVKLQYPVSLTAAFADKGAGDYVIAGHNPTGFVAVGHPERGFERLYRGNDGEQFIAAVRYHDAIYVADASDLLGGVFTIDATGKQPAPFSDFKTLGPARDLRLAGSVLWALFENAVVRFDGTNWEAFTHPADL